MDDNFSGRDWNLATAMVVNGGAAFQIMGDLGQGRVLARPLATSIAVMNAGRLQQVGTPQKAYDRPANLFVAGFMGAPAMNLIDATLVRERGDGSPATLFLPAAERLAAYCGAAGGSTVSVHDRHDKLLVVRSSHAATYRVGVAR